MTHRKLTGLPEAGLDKSQNGDQSEVVFQLQKFLGSGYITLIFTTLGGSQSADIDRYPPYHNSLPLSPPRKFPATRRGVRNKELHLIVITLFICLNELQLIHSS